MNPNAQASRQRIAGMLARFLGNYARVDCSPAKAALAEAAAKTKKVAGTPETSGQRQLLLIF